MKTKEFIIASYKKNKKRFKPTFLLAWSKYLTYDELQKVNQLEAYDAEVLKNNIKSSKEWDKNVLLFTQDNVIRSLFIELYKATLEINTKQYSNLMEVPFNDIRTWLYILDDDTIKTPVKLTKESIMKFYYDIDKKYNFKLF